MTGDGRRDQPALPNEPSGGGKDDGSWGGKAKLTDRCQPAKFFLTPGARPIDIGAVVDMPDQAPTRIVFDRHRSHVFQMDDRHALAGRRALPRPDDGGFFKAYPQLLQLAVAKALVRADDDTLVIWRSGNSWQRQNLVCSRQNFFRQQRLHTGARPGGAGVAAMPGAGLAGQAPCFSTTTALGFCQGPKPKEGQVAQKMATQGMRKADAICSAMLSLQIMRRAF
jgi:hypothetical protein